MRNSRLFAFKGILWFFAGLGAAAAVNRFTMGLGVSTALSDTTPWGLWVGFNEMGVIALSAVAFTVAAVVHIFHRGKYHAVARYAILTGFLGYGAAVTGLLFELGLPWHIWHPIIYWNIHSPLFEISWCVMLYLTVLTLEVAPVILERTPFQRVRRFLASLSLPIVILGIMISTLHQSTLGTLLLIMAFRVYPLWYSHWLPELFFVSSICMGLSLMILVYSTISWVYKRRPEPAILDGLAKVAAWALAFYFVFKMVDLTVQHKLSLIFAGTWESNLFILETLLSAIIPIALYAIPGVRRSPLGVWLASCCAVLGFVLDRVNVSGLSQVWATRVFYFPAWPEFAISLGIVSACGLLFFFIQEHFPVDPHMLEIAERDRQAAATSLPRFAPFTQVWLGEGWRKAAKVYSMLFIVPMALGLTLAPESEPFIHLPAQRARGGDILRMGTAGSYVYFDHKPHQDEVKKEGSCGVCHHLHNAGDVGTTCSECHRAMYTATNTFDHEEHIRALEGNASCAKCHGEGKPLQVKATKTCQDCHQKDMMAPNPIVKKFDSPWAGSYKDAMHKMCIPCHVKKAADPAVKRPDLRYCGGCHNEGTKSEQIYRAQVLPEKSAGGPL
jgi:Ni/Fe-hydrogenase subunit HybB-like protein